MDSRNIREIYKQRSMRYQKQGVPYPGSKALGIEVDNGKCLHLLDSYMVPPVTVSRIFTTVADLQTKVEIHIVQGKSKIAAENISVSRYILNDIIPQKAGTTRLKIIFQLNNESIFRMCAENMDTGSRKSTILMQNPFGLNTRVMETEKLAVKIKNLKDIFKTHKRYIDTNLAAEIDELNRKAATAIKERNYKLFPELYIDIDILDKEIKSVVGILEGEYANY